MGFISRNDVKPKLRALVFDRWTCERESGRRASPLIAIAEGLKERGGFEVMYFDPATFDPLTGEMPFYPSKSLKEEPKPFIPNAIFTYGFNFFHIQEYYADQRHRADIVTVDFGFLRRESGYRYVVKNGKLPEVNNIARFKQLGLQFTDGRNQEGHVLVAMQGHHTDWYSKANALLHGSVKPGREVRIRRPDDEKPLEEDLNGAYALLTYNSTCLYQALLRKIPVICSEECVASEISETDPTKIEGIETQAQPKLQSFFNKLAYSQWTIDELKLGVWVEHYFKGY